MTDLPTSRSDRARPLKTTFEPARESPFLRAPEAVRTIDRVTMAAAALPLLGGLALFGWRAAVVTLIAVASCAATERLYFRVSKAPALLGRSHAYLTGLLLALTLPAAAPWYVPAVAGAFAILVGKAVFGGVGHFLWQPALAGRLAVSVFFAAALTPAQWPVLSQDKLFWGDVQQAKIAPGGGTWLGRPAPSGADATLETPPADVLAGLTRSSEPPYSALAFPPEPDAAPPAGAREAPAAGAARPAPSPTKAPTQAPPKLQAPSAGSGQAPSSKPALISRLPPMTDLLLGARAGGIGETPVLLAVLGGLYLMYRNYVKWQLPFSMLAAAAIVAAVAPIRLAGPGEAPITVWWPALAEGADVGVLYVCYQVLSGGLVVSAFFLATEMTSRPVTAKAQAVFGAGCGALAMLLQLYVDTPIPAYIAVLAMNTLTPAIEAVFRPRVLGASRLPWRRAGS